VNILTAWFYWWGSSELRDITCHTGSHSVTCHPMQVCPA